MRKPRPGIPGLAVALLAAIFPIHASGMAAQWISLGPEAGRRPAVTVLESSPQRITLRAEIPGFLAEPIAVDGRTFYRIDVPGESHLMLRGAPEIPLICRSIVVPDRARMRVRVVDAEFEEFAGYAILPSKGNLPRSVDPEGVPFTFDPAYAGNDYYPAENVRLGSPYILRDYRGVTVEILPVQVRGDGRIRVARRLTIEIVPDGPGDGNVIDRVAPPARIAADFAAIYRKHFINWPLQRNQPVLTTGPMVVITDDPFHDALLPLVNWKNQEGIPTSLVDVSAIGSGIGQIRAYIQHLYDSEGLVYVLLVGDNAQIAVPHAAGGASDATYSLVAGDDRYPDLFVGRFSAETIDQVETQVARTVAYESLPQAAAAWYQQGIGIGSDQGPGDDGEFDREHIENIRTKLLGYRYTRVDQVYDPGATRQMVISGLNAGRGLINYCGRGLRDGWITSGFSREDIATLLNDSMLPCIFSVACFNGQFENGTCFAETWMRSTRNGNPIGAVATYMSSIDQLWVPPMDAQDAAVDLLVGDSMRAFGALCYTGSCRMMDDYGTDGEDTFLTWILFGDPSVELRASAPTPLEVTHDGYLCSDQTDYSVLVPGVPRARCALYANGTLYGSAIADSAGEAMVHLAPHGDVQTLTLTVTAPDRTPFVEQINVAPVPTFPLQTEVCAPPTGILDWPDMVGAIGYDVQLGTEAGTDLIIDRFVPISTCEYDSLPYATTYSWRIRAQYACGSPGPFCDWAVFRTEQEPPPKPLLLYPPNGAGDQPGTGVLDWSDAPDSVLYRIVIRCPSGGIVRSDSTAVSEYAYDLPRGMYRWSVRGVTPCGHPGGWSEEFTFTVGDTGACGSPPALESPPDSSLCQGTAGILRWREIPGATGYIVSMRADSCGAAEEHQVGGTEYAYSNLENGRTYHWRVKEACPCSEYSGCFSFTTVGAVASQSPRLTSPPDGAIDVPPSGTLDWDDLGAGVRGYRVQIGESCREGNEYDVADSRFDYAGLQERTTYHWRVRARFDCDQWGSYSDCFSFLTGHPSAVDGDLSRGIPAALTLVTPAPNPITGPTTIRFGLPAGGSVRLSLYDVSGREIAVLARGEYPAGWHSVAWDARSGGWSGKAIANGLYLARLNGPGGVRIQRLLLIF